MSARKDENASCGRLAKLIAQNEPMTRLEQIRLRKNEKKVADAIALPITLVLAILFYIGKLLVKTLYRMKRTLWRISVAIFILFNAYSALGNIAYAPKAQAALNGYTYEANASTEHQQIVNYIIQVFGQDAPTAFKLLTDPRCHENGTLNPNAVNDNTTWGGRGKDIGVFQINDSWQEVQDKYLFNWRINVQIAYQLFIENHKHFNLWTCGRTLGL